MGKNDVFRQVHTRCQQRRAVFQQRVLGHKGSALVRVCSTVDRAIRIPVYQFVTGKAVKIGLAIGSGRR